MKNLTYVYFDRFMLCLPNDTVDECSGPGRKDDAVAYWAPKVFAIPQNRRVTAPMIRSELKEYGAWDTSELADDDENQRRIVWVAACNEAEERYAREGK